MKRLMGSPSLTAREQQIMRLLFEGQSNREMGDTLGLSGLTVRNYISTLLRKFGAKNRTGLLAQFITLRRRYHRRTHV